MGIAGRGFQPDDHRGPVRAVLVNQAFADKHLAPGAVGRSIRVAGSSGDYTTSQPVLVVGIVQVPAARRTDSLLGVLALLLSAGGLYAVVAFVVTMRSHEIAVRMAVGADARAVVRMIVRQSLRPAVIGAAVGAFGAAVVGMIYRSRLYGASPLDPVAFRRRDRGAARRVARRQRLPARRAARIEPIQILRTE